MADNTTNATVQLQVNGQQAQETLQNLRTYALELTNQIAKAAAQGDKLTLKKLRKELASTNKQIKEMESATQQVEDVMRRLDRSTPKELQRTLQTLNKQLDYMERGSDAWNQQAKKIRMVKDEIARINGELAKSQSLLERFNSKWQELQTVTMGAVAALTGVVMAGKKAVQMYAEMDQEMASVRKYTGMTAEEVERLNEEFRKIDTRTSREDLNKLAQEAGRLGKTSQEDVLGFVKAADQINVALDDLGEGATLTLSKLTSIFGDEERLGTEKSLLAVGSVINELSQNCTASAPYLAQFAQRLAGVGAQANMTIPQIMGFAAVLDANGQKVEMSATALSKVIMDMFQNTEKIATATGLNLKEFQAALDSSTNEGLLMLIQRLNELGSIDVLAPVFKDMGENGARAAAVMAALAGNIDQIVWEQGEAQKAFEEATSVTKEFEVQNSTVQASLDKARKGFQEMAITLGQELMPMLRHIISSTSATMRVMLKTIQFVKEHRIEIISLAAGIATYTLAVNLATIRTKAHNLIVKAAAVAQAAWNAVLAMNPLGALAAALVAVGTGIALYVKKVREQTNEEKKLTKAEEALLDVEKKTEEQYAEEAGKIRSLTAIINNNALSVEKRKKALQDLRAIVPDYHAELNEEGRLINNNTEALDRYLTALKASIRAKQNQDKLEEVIKQQIPIEDDIETRKKQNEALEFANEQYRKQMKDADNARKDELRKKVEQNYKIIHTNDQAIKGLKKQLKELEDAANKLAPKTEVPEGTPHIDTGHTSDLGGGGKTSSTKSNKFQAEDDWREREEALNRIAYAKGEADYDTYTKRMLEIEVDYHQKKLLHTDLEGNEEVKIQAAYYEALRKQRDNAIQGTIEDENEAYEQRQAQLKQHYADGKLSTRSYELAMEQAELEHLRNIANLYEDGSKERIKAEQTYQKTSVKYQQKHLQESKRIQEKLREQFFTKAYRLPDQESYQRDLENLELVRLQMLSAAENDNAAKLRIEAAFHEARYQLARKYNVRIADDTRNAFREAIDDSADWLKSDGGQAFTDSMQMLISGMAEIFSGLSDIINAELELQTAAIEDRYDAEISAAEGNKYKQVQIENEKEQQLAQAKNEANRKLFAMQVIQAVAQTAQSAIAAYSSAAAIPMVGWIMAPVAAAMAVAAGAIQIAAIKKQQQAAVATGYSSGGFTKPGRKDEPAGIVHAGEWVASQELLANPQARVLINTLDYAQRTNTIGSLNATDVSQSITAPAQIAKAQSSGELNALAIASVRLSATANELSQRLNEPFVTVNTVTGDTGIKRAQDEYNQIIRNKTPKSKRS